MGIGYAWEKLMVAVDIMARSTQTLQSRLADAYISSLIRITPEHDLPAELRERFQEIADAFKTTVAKGDESNATASALAMSDEQAQNIIEKIVHLYGAVCSKYPDPY